MRHSDKRLRFLVHDKAVKEVLDILEITASCRPVPKRPCDIRRRPNSREFIILGFATPELLGAMEGRNVVERHDCAARSVDAKVVIACGALLAKKSALA